MINILPNIEIQPTLDTLEQIQENRQFIIDYVEKNRDVDHVLIFKATPTPECQWGYTPWRHSEKAMNEFAKGNYDNTTCVAGSSALNRLLINLKKMPKWLPNDSDIFMLGCDDNSRLNMGLLDFVHTKDTTPQELLLRFDLPCCRVGYDLNMTWYVSIQAFAAIFTGEMYLPSYCMTELKMKSFVTEVSSIKYEYKHHSEKTFAAIYSNQYEKLSLRIAKYERRGFKVTYNRTDYVLPWIEHVFHYSMFEPNTVTESTLTPTQTKSDNNIAIGIAASSTSAYTGSGNIAIGNAYTGSIAIGNATTPGTISLRTYLGTGSVSCTSQPQPSSSITLGPTTSYTTGSSSYNTSVGYIDLNSHPKKSYDTTLMQKLQKLTMRKESDLTDLLETLHKNEVLTYQDLLLIEPSYIKNLLEEIKSCALHNAVKIIWEKGHKKYIAKVMQESDDDTEGREAVQGIRDPLSVTGPETKTITIGSLDN